MGEGLTSPNTYKQTHLEITWLLENSVVECQSDIGDTTEDLNRKLGSYRRNFKVQEKEGSVRNRFKVTPP